MKQVIHLGFDASDEAILQEIGDRLRAQGWAQHVTVPFLLSQWQSLSARVDCYSLTVDDYTNDLTARDGLEIVLAECSGLIRSKLALLVETADKEFLARTQEDVSHSLANYFKIDESSAWWWKRTPIAGPLAEYLSGSSQSG